MGVPLNHLFEGHVPYFSTINHPFGGIPILGNLHPYGVRHGENMWKLVEDWGWSHISPHKLAHEQRNQFLTKCTRRIEGFEHFLIADIFKHIHLWSFMYIYMYLFICLYYRHIIWLLWVTWPMRPFFGWFRRIPKGCNPTTIHWSSESAELLRFQTHVFVFFPISRCMNLIWYIMYIYIIYIYISYTIYYNIIWYIECQFIVHWFSTWDDPRNSTWGIFGEGFHIFLDTLLIKSFHGWLLDVGGTKINNGG